MEQNNFINFVENVDFTGFHKKMKANNFINFVENVDFTSFHKFVKPK